MKFSEYMIEKDGLNYIVLWVPVREGSELYISLGTC